MGPAGVQAPQQTTAPAPTTTVPRKKFQVVPVPGEFSRGRWKCVDTRGGSTMGVFGNYPVDNEYKALVTYKNNIITVRKKFYRMVPEPPEEKKPEPVKSHITVVSSVDRVYNNDPQPDPSNFHVSPRQEVEVIIMSPPQPLQPPQPPPQQHSSTVIISSQQTHTTPNPAVTGHSPTHHSTSAKEEEEGIAASTSNTVVAIDNKIVQAMDLVKTHLTFAVREEVETLRSTISDLENKVTALREENRILRENVAPEVLAFITANTHLCENAHPSLHGFLHSL